MGRAPLIVDILPEIEGVDFDNAWQNRVDTVIDSQTGLTASFISSQDLMAAKLAVGRPQDIADGAALRKAAENKKADKSNRPGVPLLIETALYFPRLASVAPQEGGSSP